MSFPFTLRGVNGSPSQPKKEVTLPTSPPRSPKGTLTRTGSTSPMTVVRNPPIPSKQNSFGGRPSSPSLYGKLQTRGTLEPSARSPKSKTINENLESEEDSNYDADSQHTDLPYDENYDGEAYSLPETGRDSFNSSQSMDSPRGTPPNLPSHPYPNSNLSLSSSSLPTKFNLNSSSSPSISPTSTPASSSPRVPMRSPSNDSVRPIIPQYARKESKSSFGTGRAIERAIEREKVTGTADKTLIPSNSSLRNPQFLSANNSNALGNVSISPREIPMDDRKTKRLTTIVLSPTKTSKRERDHHHTPPTNASADDSDLFVNLIYSERETETMKDIFSLLVKKQPTILKNVIVDSSAGSEEMSHNFVTMGFITGTIFKLVRFFIEDEFQSYAEAMKEEEENPEGKKVELFGEHSIASLFLQICFKKLGEQYLFNFFGDFVFQFIHHEKKQSLELNPAFTDKEELEINQKLFLKKVSEYLKLVQDKETIDKMPVGIRTIAGYLHECAVEYNENGYKIDASELVGKVIIARYLNQILLHPNLFLKKAINLTSVVKRNIFLLQRFIHRIVTGEELGPKEQFFKVFEGFVESSKNEMEGYIQNLIVPSTTALTVPNDLNVVSVSELHTMHRVYYHINDILINSIDGPELKKLLDKLGSYQNKVSFSFLSPSDQKMIKSVLKERNEEAFLVTWVEKKSSGGGGKKQHRRLMVVGMNRVICITPSGKVSKEPHYLDLLEIKSTESKEASLIFKGFSLVFESDSVDDIIDSIRNAFNFNFSTLPEHLQLKLNVVPESRIREPNQPETSVCNGFIGTYRSICDYYKVGMHLDLVWDLNNLKEVYKTLDEYGEEEERGGDSPEFALDLSKYTTVAPEDSLKEPEFPPILHALRHNTYFTSFIFKNIRLERKETITNLQELLRSNTTLENLVLSGVSGIFKEGFHLVLEGLNSNPFSKIAYFDFSSSKLDDKAAFNLAKYLSQTKTELFYLDVSKTDASQKALVAIFQALQDNPKASDSLRFLSISQNTIGSEGSNQLKQLFASNILKDLSVLHMSSVAGMNLKLVVEGLIVGNVPVQKLDVSCNKLGKGEDLSIFVEYLKNCTLLEELNLASTSIPIETVTKLLTNVGDELNLDLDLKNNNLGSLGAVEIAKIAYRINNVHSLDLSDNDLGDEGVAELALGLRNNNSIRRLYLNRNFKMGKSKDRTRAVDTLIQLVTSDCTIEALHISAKPHSSSSLKHDLIPFINALESNQSLIELGISGHEMGNKGAMALGKVLQINTHLACLVWDENETGLTGFLNIKYALKINKALKYMPLPVSDIGLLVKELSREDQIKLKVTLGKIEKSIANNISQ